MQKFSDFLSLLSVLNTWTLRFCRLWEQQERRVCLNARPVFWSGLCSFRADLLTWTTCDCSDRRASTSSEIRPATNCCLTWFSRFLEEVHVFGDKFMLFRKICNFVVLWTIIITRAVNGKLEKLEQKPEKVFKKSQESDSLSFPYCFYIPINGRENSALIID